MGNLEGEFGEEMLSFLGEMMLNEEDGLAMGETDEGWVPAMPRLGQRVSRSEFVGYRSVIQSLWCIACEPEVGIVGMVNHYVEPFLGSHPALSQPSLFRQFPTTALRQQKLTISPNKIQVIIFVFHFVLTILINCLFVICYVHLLPIIALTDSINPVGSGLDQAFLPMLLLNSFTLQMHLHSADEWELTKLCIKLIDHLN